MASGAQGGTEASPSSRAVPPRDQMIGCAVIGNGGWSERGHPPNVEQPFGAAPKLNLCASSSRPNVPPAPKLGCCSCSTVHGRQFRDWSCGLATGRSQVESCAEGAVEAHQRGGV